MSALACWQLASVVRGRLTEYPRARSSLTKAGEPHSGCRTQDCDEETNSDLLLRDGECIAILPTPDVSSGAAQQSSERHLR